MRARIEDTRNATGLSPGYCSPQRIVLACISKLRIDRRSRSAGRHPCSTAWLDVRDFHPAVRGLSLAAELALRDHISASIQE
jgi:hypothetical protein